MKNDPVQNVSSADADKPCTKLMCTRAVLKKSRFFKSNDCDQYTSKINRYEIYFVVAVFLSFFPFCKVPRPRLRGRISMFVALKPLK